MLAINQRLYSLASPSKLRAILLVATNNNGIRKQQKAGICHKSKLYKDGKKPYTFRFNYEKYPYNFFTCLYDPFCRSKNNENSKIILIEGNVAAGKGEFGKRLAEELDMKYVGQPNLDDIYINSYGFDYRALNSLIPEHFRICDLDMFHEQPNRHSVIHMQQYLSQMRGFQYLQVLSHVLNTGQGVVMERSIFTERVFVESMHRMGWLPIGYSRPDGCEFYDWRYRYNYIRKLFTRTMPAPHLTIYLDVPPEECHNRIRQGSDKVQANSQALTPEFLKKMDEYYKNELLQYCDEFGHVLRYDYTKGMDEGRLADIIDDIEDLDFTIDPHDTRFKNWTYEDFKYWFFDWRRRASSKYEHMRWFYQPYYDVAGLGDVITNPELILLDSIKENHVVGYSFNKNYDWRFSNWIKALFAPIDYTTYQKIRFFQDFR